MEQSTKELILFTLTDSFSFSQFKYLADGCGAEMLKKIVLVTHNCDKIVYLCELGADNYNEIYSNNIGSVNVIVYLLNKTNVLKDVKIRNKYVRLYLRAGAGRLLEYYPELLESAEAKPYLERRANIVDILRNYLIDDTIYILLDYLSYELPDLSDQHMAEVLFAHFNTD